MLALGEGDFSGTVDCGTDDRSIGDDTVRDVGAVAQPTSSTAIAPKTSPLKSFLPLARSNMPCFGAGQMPAESSVEAGSQQAISRLEAVEPAVAGMKLVGVQGSTGLWATIGRMKSRSLHQRLRHNLDRCHAFERYRTGCRTSRISKEERRAVMPDSEDIEILRGAAIFRTARAHGRRPIRASS